MLLYGSAATDADKSAARVATGKRPILHMHRDRDLEDKKKDIDQDSKKDIDQDEKKDIETKPSNGAPSTCPRGLSSLVVIKSSCAVVSRRNIPRL